MEGPELDPESMGKPQVVAGAFANDSSVDLAVVGVAAPVDVRGADDRVLVVEHPRLGVDVPERVARRERVEDPNFGAARGAEGSDELAAAEVALRQIADRSVGDEDR